jgi:hypothetical protein
MPDGANGLSTHSFFSYLLESSGAQRAWWGCGAFGVRPLARIPNNCLAPLVIVALSSVLELCHWSLLTASQCHLGRRSSRCRASRRYSRTPHTPCKHSSRECSHPRGLHASPGRLVGGTPVLCNWTAPGVAQAGHTVLFRWATAGVGPCGRCFFSIFWILSNPCKLQDIVQVWFEVRKYEINLVG